MSVVGGALALLDVSGLELGDQSTHTSLSLLTVLGGDISAGLSGLSLAVNLGHLGALDVGDVGALLLWEAAALSLGPLGALGPGGGVALLLVDSLALLLGHVDTVLPGLVVAFLLGDIATLFLGDILALLLRNLNKNRNIIKMN